MPMSHRRPVHERFYSTLLRQRGEGKYSCSTSRLDPLRSAGLMVRSAYNRIGSIPRDTYGGVARALYRVFLNTWEVS